MASPKEEAAEETTSPSRKRKGAVEAKTSPKKKKTAAKKDASPAPKKARARKGEDSSSTKASKKDELPEVDDGATESLAKKKKTSPKKKAAADHQRITERDPLPRLWDAQAAAEKDESDTFRIASWNVAGLRALMRNHPTALIDLCKEHDLDMLCLQETKLQEIHLDDPKLKLRGCLSDAGYDEYWSCSTTKKGYSGTAVFVKQRGAGKKTGKKQSDIGSFFAPVKKSKVKGQSQAIDDEGRTITLEFPFATITNVYVPNSGKLRSVPRWQLVLASKLTSFCFPI
jgi:hypothetical protein